VDLLVLLFVVVVVGGGGGGGGVGVVVVVVVVNLLLIMAVGRVYDPYILTSGFLLLLAKCLNLGSLIVSIRSYSETRV
jgi:hypothetical protein